jgi:hypothetical protein
MPNNEIDLASLFTQVTSALSQQKTQLNEVDAQNHDHGDNMVQIFNLISQAVQKKQGSNPSVQLKNAAAQVKRLPSGSAQVYAKGLLAAAQQFKGKNVTVDNALQLAQTLLGGGQAPASSAGSDMIGALLGQLGGENAAGTGEIKPEALLNAGLAFLNAKNSGDSNASALVKALVSDSAMGDSAHRTQSGEVVMKTLLDVVGSLAKK